MSSVVLQRSGAVEDKVVGCGVGVNHKIALLEQLVVVLLSNTVFYNRCMEFAAERAFNLDSLYLEAVRVQQIAEIAFLCRWVLYGKQAVIQACFGIEARVALHPVDSGFGLAVAALGARLGSGVVGGIDGGDITLGIFLAAGGLDDIRRFEAYRSFCRLKNG